jgi:hypothetical protein
MITGEAAIMEVTTEVVAETVTLLKNIMVDIWAP